MKQLIIIAAVLLLVSCEKEDNNILKYEADCEYGGYVWLNNYGPPGDLYTFDDGESWSKEVTAHSGDEIFIGLGQSTICYQRVAVYYEGELLEEDVTTTGNPPKVRLTVP
ncbi:MAG: hypothetical protein K9I29_04975 [Bacteroidales bacterium]|nr:hypothetical protein [Bacteroidales bacterium]MCF8327626.1 hypothetical protein [Bacteroidales bacterium]